MLTLLWAVVFLALAQTAPRDAAALDIGSSPSFAQLVSLPLEDVVNIRVTPAQGSDDEGGGTLVLTRRQLRAVQPTLRNNEVCFSRGAPENGDLPACIGGAAHGKVLLAIDGFRVGLLDSIRDLPSYVTYLGVSAVRAEIYFGVQSRVWDATRPEITINIVTRPEGLRAASIRGRLAVYRQERRALHHSEVMP
jgi:hypothetical protein